MTAPFERPLEPSRIKVVGVGGAGCHIIRRLMDAPPDGFDLIIIDSDWACVRGSEAHRKVEIGGGLARGLGTGGHVDWARRAAGESAEQIREAFRGADLVLLAAGLGGGTGSGATPVVADIARACGAAVLALVSLPLVLEGRRRARVAAEGLTSLGPHVDGRVVLPAERVLKTVDPRTTSIVQFYQHLDETLGYAVKVVVQLLSGQGIICVDRADVLSTLASGEIWTFGAGSGSGESAAEDATRMAAESPILAAPLNEAGAVLFCLRSDPDVGLRQVVGAVEALSSVIGTEVPLLYDVFADRAERATASATVLGMHPGAGLEASLLASLGDLRPPEFLV